MDAVNRDRYLDIALEIQSDSGSSRNYLIEPLPGEHRGAGSTFF